MVFTPRRRAAIAILLSWPFGYFYLDFAIYTAANIVRSLRYGHQSAQDCSSGWRGYFNSCTEFKPVYAWIELIGSTLIALAVAGLVARWVVQPLRDVAENVGRFGPTSLGLRLRATGPRDEIRRLSDEIDAMLDRLAEGYEAQRRFASTASHELRTPLATQRALIEISLASALTPDQLELLTRQLLSTNERNERLIDGLLTLAETDRGLAATTRVRFDRVVTDVVDTLRPQAQERDVELSSVTEEVAVIGELPLVDRLASNLVQNAIKYNQPGGSVVVNLTANGVLTVVNTGPDVPAALVPGLFEPFRRISGERLDHGGGVGLGLTIARSIVAAHNGSIRAQPNPGGGLIVEAWLRPVQ